MTKPPLVFDDFANHFRSTLRIPDFLGSVLVAAAVVRKTSVQASVSHEGEQVRNRAQLEALRCEEYARDAARMLELTLRVLGRAGNPIVPSRLLKFFSNPEEDLRQQPAFLVELVEAAARIPYSQLGPRTLMPEWPPRFFDDLPYSDKDLTVMKPRLLLRETRDLAMRLHEFRSGLEGRATATLELPSDIPLRKAIAEALLTLPNRDLRDVEIARGASGRIDTSKEAVARLCRFAELPLDYALYRLCDRVGTAFKQGINEVRSTKANTAKLGWAIWDVLTKPEFQAAIDGTDPDGVNELAFSFYGAVESADGTIAKVRSDSLRLFPYVVGVAYDATRPEGPARHQGSRDST